MSTERLYYNDAYLASFTAQVAEVSADGRRVYLDRTAFYPASGGQPHDTGRIAAMTVAEVVDEDGRIAHVVDDAVRVPVSSVVECTIDWVRRFDHMQQHTGQHLLSAVLFDLYGAQTISFHMGAELCTIDVSVASLAVEDLRNAEVRANAIVAENRAVTVSFEDAEAASGLRKASEREGTLRIIGIDGIDRSACGGTHVRQTGEIGCILLRGTERVRGNLRVEFVCGSRAVRRARSDFDALSAVARSLCSPLEETPRMVAAQIERLSELERSRRKLAIEAATYRGRQLFSEVPPSASGVRVHVRKADALDDELRTEAQSFTGAGRAVFIGFCEQPAAVLIASSPDSGLHAGNALKAAIARAGGRGGGSAQAAQGSVPEPGKLQDVLHAIQELIP